MERLGRRRGREQRKGTLVHGEAKELAYQEGEGRMASLAPLLPQPLGEALIPLEGTGKEAGFKS